MPSDPPLRARPGPEDDIGSPGPSALGPAVPAVVLAGLVLLVVGGGWPLLRFVGWYLVSSVVPAWVIVRRRPRAPVLVFGLGLCVVGVAAGLGVRAVADDPWFARHDGGVVVTEAAAQDVRHGRNPYTADYAEALGPHLHLQATGGEGPLNPLVRHYPYLPGAFLVQVPVSALAGLVGAAGDPRIVQVAAFLAALGILATRRAPEPERGAALVALGANLAVASYLSWGANDTAAASLLVVAAYLARRRPVLAGVLAGLALSFKILLIVAVVPVIWVLGRRLRRRRCLAFVGSLAGFLVATAVPYLLASPGDFIDDTIRFNLGRTELTYPTSGLGLGAVFPGTFTEDRIAIASVALIGTVGVLAALWLRRRPELGVALACGGLLVVAGLLPARTFQISYLPLPVVLLAPVWCERRTTEVADSTAERSGARPGPPRYATSSPEDVGGA